MPLKEFRVEGQQGAAGTRDLLSILRGLFYTAQTGTLSNAKIIFFPQALSTSCVDAEKCL